MDMAAATTEAATHQELIVLTTIKHTKMPAAANTTVLHTTKHTRMEDAIKTGILLPAWYPIYRNMGYQAFLMRLNTSIIENNM